MKRHSHCSTHVTAKTLRPFLLPRCGVCRTCGSVGGSLGSDWSLLSPSRSHAHSMKSASLDLLRIASTCMIFENESFVCVTAQGCTGHSCNSYYLHASYVYVIYGMSIVFFSFSCLYASLFALELMSQNKCPIQMISRIWGDKMHDFFQFLVDKMMG